MTAPDLLPQPPAKRSSKRWTAVALTSGAVVVAAGLGIAGYAQADPTPSPGAPSAAPSGQPGDPRGGPGRHGGDRGAFKGELAKELASKLGVTQAKVETALKEVREANRAAKPSTAPSASPSTPPAKPDRSARDAELAKALAPKLNVSEAKVKTALDEIRAAHAADRAKALKTKLDAAVKAGTLTQAEADAVSKAVEKGVINVGPR